MKCKKGGFYLATLLVIVSVIFLMPAFSPIADDGSSGTTSVSVNSRSGGVTTIHPSTNRPIQIDGVNCTTIISYYNSAKSRFSLAQIENNLQAVKSIKKYLSDNLWKYNRCIGFPVPIEPVANADFSETAVRQVACTMDVKICPDGSAVGRVGPNCEFAQCPTEGTTTSKQPQLINNCETIMREITSAYGDYQNAYRLKNTEKMASIKGAIAKLEQSLEACLGGETRPSPSRTAPAQVKPIESAGVCNDLKSALTETHSQYWKYVLEGNFSMADRMNSSLLSEEKNYFLACMGIYLYEETIAGKVFQCRDFLKTNAVLKKDYLEAFKANDTERAGAIADRISEGVESYLSCVKEKLGGLSEKRETSCEELSRINEEYSKARSLLSSKDEDLKALGLDRNEAVKRFESVEYKLKVAKRYCSLTEDPKGVPNKPIPMIMRGNVTKIATATEAPCGEAKGLGERVIYLKGLLLLSDDELSQKGLAREDVREKFEDADKAYNKAMYNCVEKRNTTLSPVSVNGPCWEAKELEQRILYIKKILGLTESEFSEKFAGKNRTSFDGELSGLSGKYSELVSKCREAQGEKIANNPCGKSPAELLEKYSISVQKMNDARKSGEESLFKELEKSLVDLKKEISSYNNCVAGRELASETHSSAARSISDYYLAQLVKFPGKETGDGLADEIARMTALREEISRRIRALVEKRTAIDARELSGVAKIEVSDSGVSVNGENVSDSTEGGEVIATIGISEASIVSANGTVSIDDGSDFETTANSPVTVENGRLKINGRNVSASPGEFSAALRFAPEKVELGEGENGEPQYVAKATEKRRLFFIIPVTSEVVQRMNAENGTFYKEERPFWVFLSSKVQ